VNQPDWTRVREHYRRNTLAIYEAGPSDWGIDPYAWDHDAGIQLTPIEYALWCDIRAVGVVLYPQYPVGGYFVDFANPVARVAIECDGARWHTNPHRDADRQAEIEANGWAVYRIGGAACKVDEIRECPETGFNRFVGSPGYSLVKAVAERHGIRFNGKRRNPVEPYVVEAT
jgi:hypothetical protein